MPDLTTSETLNLAADLIEERGWEQRDGWQTAEREADAPLCLEGALAAAGGFDLDHPQMPGFLGPGYDKFLDCPLYAAVSSYLEMGGLALFSWNDRTGRTAEEVLAVLRATAVIESAREVRTTLAGLPGSEVPA